MARHEVNMRLPKEQVVSADIEFSVKRNGSKLGELHVSKGNVEWWPARSKSKKKRLGWQELADLFEEFGTVISN
jgi:hypothetical protein